MGKHPMRAALLALVASALGLLFWAVTGSNLSPKRMYRIGTNNSYPYHRLDAHGEASGLAVDEVQRALKQAEELRRIAVIVLTTSAAPRDVEAACSNHAGSYVKPREFGEFNALRKETGLYWLARNDSLARLGEACKA
jgi:hypothetical protein